MNLNPLTVEQVTKLFTLEELTALGEAPHNEMFGRILTKAVIAQRDQDQEVMVDLYEALKELTSRLHTHGIVEVQAFEALAEVKE